jgi:hypothetical protein
MRLQSFDVPTVRAAWWAHKALRAVREDLKANGLGYSSPPAPPRLPSAAERGVSAVLRRQPFTCLERALVLQRWQAAQGSKRDVIVAVTNPSEFAAHAWVDGEPEGDVSAYAELMRLPPR